MLYEGHGKQTIVKEISYILIKISEGNSLHINLFF